MTLPKNLTLDRIIEAVQDDEYIGFCLSCGEIVAPLEPDARKCHCDHCDSDMAYGAEELLIMFGI